MVRVLSNVDARLHHLERQVPGRSCLAVLDAFCDGLTEAGHRYTVEDDASHRLRPDVPVTANVGDQNPASLRVLDKIGLKPVWHGDGQASGLTCGVYADRDLESSLLQRVIAQ